MGLVFFGHKMPLTGPKDTRADRRPPPNFQIHRVEGPSFKTRPQRALEIARDLSHPPPSSHIDGQWAGNGLNREGGGAGPYGTVLGDTPPDITPFQVGFETLLIDLEGQYCARWIALAIHFVMDKIIHFGHQNICNQQCKIMWCASTIAAIVIFYHILKIQPPKYHTESRFLIKHWI